jgi:predicted nucleotidyltransferase
MKREKTSDMTMADHLTAEEEKAVAEIKQKVLKLAGSRLKGFYLFGSKARGDYDPESDVDLAILIEGLDRETKKAIIDIAVDVELEHGVVISPLVLSREDFSGLKARERRIALDIESEGIPL